MKSHITPPVWTRVTLGSKAYKTNKILCIGQCNGTKQWSLLLEFCFAVNGLTQHLESARKTRRSGAMSFNLVPGPFPTRDVTARECAVLRPSPRTPVFPVLSCNNMTAWWFLSSNAQNEQRFSSNHSCYSRPFELNPTAAELLLPWQMVKRWLIHWALSCEHIRVSDED